MKLHNKIILIGLGQLVVIMVAIFLFVWFFDVDLKNTAQPVPQALKEGLDLEEKVLPADGFILPVDLKDFGRQMIEKGVIDEEKFSALYSQRGGFDENILSGSNNQNPVINNHNSGFLLNFLWAFGLANKNPILEEGPMRNEEFGGAGNFASTGGWSLSVGRAMDHYSRYEFVSLTSEQQALVEEVSSNIYRPCCGNSTYFPDCNHGMAMLGLLEILASQGASEEEMYETALAVNAYWFPQNYLTIAKYFESQGTAWKEVNAKEALGFDYSSALGFRNILAKVTPPTLESGGGGGCGV